MASVLGPEAYDEIKAELFGLSYDEDLQLVAEFGRAVLAARNGTVGDVLDAVDVDAVALEILIMAPIRLHNLLILRFGEELLSGPRGSGGVLKDAQAASADQLRPHTRRLPRQVAQLVRDLPPEHLEAWLACGRRIVGGMPVAEAEALMWRELAAAGEV